MSGPHRRSVGPPGPPEPEASEGKPPPGPEPEAPGPGPDRGPELPPGIRRFLRRGVLLFPVAVAAIWAATSVGFWNALFLAVLLELLPVLAVAQVPLAAGQALERTPAYLGSAAAILFLGWVALLLGRGTVGASAMGLDAVPARTLLLWAGVAFAGGMALVGLFHLVERLLGVEEPPLLRQLLPRTGREKLLFVGVSLSAGVGEELAYRGYAIPLLAGLVGSEWTAAVLSSGVFGFLHAYQGQVGVVRTGLMGMLLAAVFVWTGSLWPAILAHAAIDLVGGLVIGPRLLDEG